MAEFCTNCGNEIGDGVAFCTECGTPRDAAAAPPAQKPAPQSAPPTPAQTEPRTGKGKEEAPPAGSRYAPITAKGYIGIMLLMCIPVFGLLLAIIWACGGCKKINKRNLARASLVMMAVGLVIALILGLAAKIYIRKLKDSIEAQPGVSITQEDDRADAEKNGFGGLRGLLGGKDDPGVLILKP